MQPADTSFLRKHMDFSVYFTKCDIYQYTIVEGFWLFIPRTVSWQKWF